MDASLEDIRAQVQFTERNIRILEETVIKMIRKREDSQQFLQVLSENMHNVAAQEHCPELNQCITELAESFRVFGEKTNVVMTQRPEAHILQVLTQIQDWGVVPMKRLLDEWEKIIRAESRLKSEYERAGNEREKEKKKRLLSDQKRRKENANELLTYHLAKFEYFRTVKLKKVYQEIVRSHTFYHAKGLETFASPCSGIAKLTPKDTTKTSMDLPEP